MTQDEDLLKKEFGEEIFQAIRKRLQDVTGEIYPQFLMPA